MKRISCDFFVGGALASLALVWWCLQVDVDGAVRTVMTGMAMPRISCVFAEARRTGVSRVGLVAVSSDCQVSSLSAAD